VSICRVPQCMTDEQRYEAFGRAGIGALHSIGRAGTRRSCRPRRTSIPFSPIPVLTRSCRTRPSHLAFQSLTGVSRLQLPPWPSSTLDIPVRPSAAHWRGPKRFPRKRPIEVPRNQPELPHGHRG
jgi:hypothetical protein